MGMRMVSNKQLELLNIIKIYIDNNGISPTVRELSELMGHSSTSTTHAMLKQLENRGYISKIKESPRSIKIVG